MAHKPVVLVVEDEPLVRCGAVVMVEETGFEAIAVCDADEAIHILESRSDIRAVFTDSDARINGRAAAGLGRERALATGRSYCHIRQSQACRQRSANRWAISFEAYGSSRIKASLRQLIA
jgi:CheY-like chemotaxis protein